MCPLGELQPGEARALRLRARLLALRDLVGAEAVLRMEGADLEDIEMLEAIEDERKAIDEEKRQRNG